jgi:hypothetical protein
VDVHVLLWILPISHDHSEVPGWVFSKSASLDPSVPRKLAEHIKMD